MRGPATASAASAPSRAPSTTTSGSCGPPFSSTSREFGSPSTAPTARPIGPRRVIFGALGADLVTMGVEPDGRNINADCGSTHPEGLVDLVKASKAQIGFAYDGDGDRVLAVDGNGRLHDGDDLIALIARDLQRRDELEGGVAVTVMTNFGFMQTMDQAGIEVVQTQVGDRHVIEQLLKRDWNLGGEQSATSSGRTSRRPATGSPPPCSC